MTMTEFNGKKLFRWEPSDGSAVFLGSYVLKLLLQVIIVIVLGVTDVDPDFSKTIAFKDDRLCVHHHFVQRDRVFAHAARLRQDQGLRHDTRHGLRGQVFALGDAARDTPFGRADLLGTAARRRVYQAGRADRIRHFRGDVDHGELAATLILVALLPAIAEEYVFRGCVARAFARKGYVFAVFMSALLFAIMHGSPLQLVHQFLIGVVCAVLFFATRSLWPPIILHFLNNAIALVLGYVQNRGSAFAVTEAWQYVVMCVVGVAATIGLLIAVIYLCKARAAKVDPESGAAKRADMERTLRSLYESPEVRGAAQAELDALDAELAEAKSEQMAEVIKEARRESANKTKLRDRRALIYAFLFAGVLWILMFILNIVGVQ